MQLIDNINNLWGDDLKESIKSGSKLKLAASTFSIYAFEALKKELKNIDSFEFVFTSPAFVPSDVSDKIKKEHREFKINKQANEKELYGTDFEIQLRNKLTQKAIAKECAAWIRKKCKFKSTTDSAPMQSFAYIETGTTSTSYIQFQGFSAVDLGYQKGNALSNFVTKSEDHNFTKQWLSLFEQIWSDDSKLKDVTETICDHIDSVYQENSPQKIYFLILYNVFKDFLEDINEDVLPNQLTGYKDTVIWNTLYNFQRDAATGIINKLEKYNGCILADSVGLGKTFTALAVIKYYELRNKSVLVLCPKKLADNWTNYNANLKTNILAKDRMAYDVLCHTDLLRTSGKSYGIPLNKVNWANYDLIVIDESHNFRNNDAFKDKETRYKKLLKYIVEGVKTKVLMLSATPVNNRFNDLRNQLALAYEGDSENLSSKLKTGKSIEEIFRQAQKVFNEWSNLTPEERTAAKILNQLDFDFFELLDSVTIARSRKHIETFYDTTDIGKFPERRQPVSYRCPLTHLDNVIDFNAIYSNLSNLKLGIYTPITYVFDSRVKKYEEIYDTSVKEGKGILKQKDREDSLKYLMTTSLLKRLESSVGAFRLTLQSLESKYFNILEIVNRFKDNGGEYLLDDLQESVSDMEYEDDEFSSFEVGGKIKINLADMDVESYSRDLEADLAIIKFLLSEMDKVTIPEDAKLQHLKSKLFEKIDNPINEGNKKVLVFSAYADTAEYLYNYLSPILKDKGIHSAIVSGKNTPKNTLQKGVDFQEILTLFSPVSKSKHLILPDIKGEIDVLFATDCISEGQNLQDCDYLINYDIHWNPVRIIQRFGRVDRIGSKNKYIQLVNYWPDISLDEYINLKERVENRMIITDVTATGDDNVLSAKANDVSYRKEQLRKLQDEVIELEDLKTGINITNLGLNDFKMDLLKFLQENPEIEKMPNGLHAVVPANHKLGLEPGVIFALKNRNESVNINQQNRLHPYYIVYIDQNANVLFKHTEVKHLLDLLRAGAGKYNTPIDSITKEFNLETDDGRNMSQYSDLLGDAIKSIVEVKEERDIDSLFSSKNTTALLNTIKGLNDFELIAFIVVREEV